MSIFYTYPYKVRDDGIITSTDCRDDIQHKFTPKTTEYDIITMNVGGCKL